MANTKSIKKITDFIREKDGAVSISEIVVGAGLRWKTVKDVLGFLDDTNQILILSSGKTTLIQFKQEAENATTN